ncbi:Gfo/Idh/MocA family oxidoreductase [Sinorhizobium saheli]|uniref:Gfo/Idh/MocA family protein n=1 Tax=Sinorhizobium saheli TaxID=36856 RepID=UPI001F1D5A88|nr:Gfo/Idh/MocA family oxidoreductase [Sinorhizobium saheli]
MPTISCIQFTGQNIASVRAEFHNCGAPKRVEDTAYVNFRLENGAPGILWVTQAAPGQYCGLRIRVWGDMGGLDWDQEKPEVLRYVPLGEQSRFSSAAMESCPRRKA